MERSRGDHGPICSVILVSTDNPEGPVGFVCPEERVTAGYSVCSEGLVCSEGSNGPECSDSNKYPSLTLIRYTFCF